MTRMFRFPGIGSRGEFSWRENIETSTQVRTSAHTRTAITFQQSSKMVTFNQTETNQGRSSLSFVRVHTLCSPTTSRNFVSDANGRQFLTFFSSSLVPSSDAMAPDQKQSSLAPQAFSLGFSLLCFAQCSEFETDFSSEEWKGMIRK